MNILRSKLKTGMGTVESYLDENLGVELQGDSLAVISSVGKVKITEPKADYVKSELTMANGTLPNYLKVMAPAYPILLKLSGNNQELPAFISCAESIRYEYILPSNVRPNLVLSQVDITHSKLSYEDLIAISTDIYSRIAKTLPHKTREKALAKK